MESDMKCYYLFSVTRIVAHTTNSSTHTVHTHACTFHCNDFWNLVGAVNLSGLLSLKAYHHTPNNNNNSNDSHWKRISSASTAFKVHSLQHVRFSTTGRPKKLPVSIMILKLLNRHHNTHIWTVIFVAGNFPCRLFRLTIPDWSIECSKFYRVGIFSSERRLLTKYLVNDNNDLSSSVDFLTIFPVVSFGRFA